MRKAATNIPYRRGMGPMTKDKPYVQDGLNRRDRSNREKRLFNNRKTHPTLVVRIGPMLFQKVRKRLQVFQRKVVVHYDAI